MGKGETGALLAYDKPTRGVWSYDGRDEEFRAGESWRNAYKSTD